MKYLTIEEYQKAYPDGEVIHAINHIGRHKNAKAELNWIQSRINAEMAIKEYMKLVDDMASRDEIENSWQEYDKWNEVASSFSKQLNHDEDWQAEAEALAADAKDLEETYLSALGRG